MLTVSWKTQVYSCSVQIVHMLNPRWLFFLEWEFVLDLRDSSCQNSGSFVAVWWTQKLKTSNELLHLVSQRLFPLLRVNSYKQGQNDLKFRQEETLWVHHQSEFLYSLVEPWTTCNRVYLVKLCSENFQLFQHENGNLNINLISSIVCLWRLWDMTQKLQKLPNELSCSLIVRCGIAIPTCSCSQDRSCLLYPDGGARLWLLSNHRCPSVSSIISDKLTSPEGTCSPNTAIPLTSIYYEPIHLLSLYLSNRCSPSYFPSLSYCTEALVRSL